MSKAEFIANMQISLKATAETEYWLRMLVMYEHHTEAEGESLITDCLELRRSLTATLNTAMRAEVLHTNQFIKRICCSVISG